MVSHYPGSMTPEVFAQIREKAPDIAARVPCNMGWTVGGGDVCSHRCHWLYDHKGEHACSHMTIPACTESCCVKPGAAVG